MKVKNYLISIFCIISVLSFTACQKSMEEKAAKDAAEYTRKYCPTPYVNHIRTDSVTFDINKQQYTYYCTMNGILDSQEVIDLNKKKIHDLFVSSIKESPTMKPYIEAGFHFRYVCRSESDPELILIQVDL